MSMTLGDIETAVRHCLPLTIIVMNDRADGSELIHLEAAGSPWDQVLLPDIDFAAVGTALGVEAATVRTVNELPSGSGRIVGRSQPLLLDCKIRTYLFVRRATWRRTADASFWMSDCGCRRNRRGTRSSDG
jgi:thiamine pyrophosphate-dependent acetolactate synthase large subunit-like protein